MSNAGSNPIHGSGVELAAYQERSRRDALRLGARSGYSQAPEIEHDSDDIEIGPNANSHRGDKGRARQIQGAQRRKGERDRLEHLTLFIERQGYAANRCRQIPTLSTIIIIAQIVLLWYIIDKDGMAQVNENPTYGPSAYALVHYGAKQGGLIVYKGEWWRLVTPIFLHAGIVHIVMNVYLQMQLGGFLNLLFGTIPWTLIYFLSGIYGNILSCIVDPDTVGVGSSGALMGVLSSYAVFIIFTWSKFPDDWHSSRNCNLFSLLLAMTVTMLLSMVEFIDGAAHGGGMAAGALLAMLLLAGEIDGCCGRWFIRMASLVSLVIMYAYSLNYLYTKVHPSRDVMDMYWQGED